MKLICCSIGYVIWVARCDQVKRWSLGVEPWLIARVLPQINLEVKHNSDGVRGLFATKAFAENDVLSAIPAASILNTGSFNDSFAVRQNATSARTHHSFAFVLSRDLRSPQVLLVDRPDCDDAGAHPYGAAGAQRSTQVRNAHAFTHALPPRDSLPPWLWPCSRFRPYIDMWPKPTEVVNSCNIELKYAPMWKNEYWVS
jgi:hypothetical protein